MGVALHGSTALAQVGKRPLSVAEVEYLVQGQVSPRRIVEIIEEQGVAFEVTPAIREQLRKAGANESILTAVERAALEVVHKRTEEAKKQDEARRKQEEARRKIAEDASRKEGVHKKPEATMQQKTETTPTS